MFRGIKNVIREGGLREKTRFDCFQGLIAVVLAPLCGDAPCVDPTNLFEVDRCVWRIWENFPAVVVHRGVCQSLLKLAVMQRHVMSTQKYFSSDIHSDIVEHEALSRGARATPFVHKVSILGGPRGDCRLGKGLDFFMLRHECPQCAMLPLRVQDGSFFFRSLGRCIMQTFELAAIVLLAELGVHKHFMRQHNSLERLV